MAVEDFEKNDSLIQNSDVWVVIPAFNEASSISLVLDQFLNSGYSVLVIDDCSNDNTSQICLNYPVTLLKHLVNLGQGASLQTGFDFLINFTHAKFVITFDSDGQHDIKDIPNILEPLISGEYDVVLGSRFLKTKFVDGMPRVKLLTLKSGILFTRITTGLKVTDTHNGLRGFSINALRKIHINHNRMAHASEILTKIARNKFRYCEIPVNIHYTEYSKRKGQSIFNSINILWDLFTGRD